MKAQNPLSPVIRSLLESDVGASEAFHTLVQFALHQGAGDLYLTSHRTGYSIGMRRDGIVQPLGEVEKEWGERIVGYVKVEANLASAEHRRPQDGHIVLFQDDEAETAIDLRVSILPTAYGEDLAVRLLYRRADLLEIDNLGMWPEQINWVRDVIARPHGLVLVTGPTGSGKTTTLYAMLRELNNGTRKINTIEDPVEFDLAGIHQSQVNPAIGIDFSDLLPAVLRQDPDIIMVGEVRDPATANIALRAAITGQLVLATMHAADTAGAIHAMLGLGGHPHLLACALRGVIAQSLIRKICTHCSRPLSQTGALSTFDDVKHHLGSARTPVLHQGRGCKECLQTGYHDRTGIFEMMTVTPQIASLVESAAPSPAIHQEAIDNGMLSLSEVGKVTVARGVTTLEEVMRVIELPAPQSPRAKRSAPATKQEYVMASP